jgi:hypothetical protein
MAAKKDIVVEVGGDTGPLDKSMKKGAKSVLGFGAVTRADLKKTAARIAKIGTVAITAGAALTAGLVKRGLAVIDSQAKLARSLGTTVKSVQALDRAGKLGGVENLAQQTAKFNARVGKAILGTGLAAEQFKKLGINAQELSEMDADERLALVADKVKALGLSSSETANMLRDFGIRNEKLVGLVLQGGGAFRQARKEVEDFGLAIEDTDAAAIEAANDSMTKIGETIQGVANRLAIEFAPKILEITNKFNELSKETGGFREQLKAVMDVSITVAKGIAGAFNFVGTAIGNTAGGLSLLFEDLQEFAASGAQVVNKFAEGFSEAWAGVKDKVGNLIPDWMMKYLKQSSPAELGSLDSAQWGRDAVTLFAAGMIESSEAVALAAAEIANKAAGMKPGGEGDAEGEFEGLLAKQEREFEIVAAHKAALAGLEVESESEKEARLKEIRKRGLKDQGEVSRRGQQAAIGAGQRLIGSLGEMNRQMFEENKGFSIAMATMSALLAGAQVLAEPSLTFFDKVAKAAAIISIGVGYASSISSISKGGGAASPGGAGGVAATPTVDVTPGAGGTGGPQQNVFIKLQGETIGQDGIRKLIKELNEASKNGGRMVFA